MMKKKFGISLSAILILTLAVMAAWFTMDMKQAFADDIKFEDRLDLQINGGATDGHILDDLKNLAPGDFGNSYTALRNVGGLAGELDIEFTPVTNIGGRGGTEYEDGVGDLGEVAEIAPWIDLSCDGRFDPGYDIALQPDGKLTRTALQWDQVNNFGNRTWTGVMDRMNSGDEYRFYLNWRIPITAGNNIQGDSFSFGIQYFLKQGRDL